MRRYCLLATALLAGLVLAAAPISGAQKHGTSARIFGDLAAQLRAAKSAGPIPVVVVLRRPATASRVAAVARAAGGVHVLRRFRSVRGFAATATRAQIRALAKLPAVLHVEADVRAAVDVDSSAQISFGIAQARIDLPGLTGNADGDPSVYSSGDLVAAVLDTGVDTGHVDLDYGKVIAWKDLVNGSSTPYDDNGHGTELASIIAGDGDGRPDHLYKGVAPGAAIVAVKITPADGVARMDKVIAGLDWVIQNKSRYNIKVVNLSLGAVGCWDGTEAASQAVNGAVDAGLVVVVAAGNGGPERCTVKSPGAAARAITVANMADLGQGGFFLVHDSSRGPTADGRIKPDIAAPGYQIPMAWAGTLNWYISDTGTSMSTAFVSGLALLMLQVNPLLTPQQLKWVLMSTAVDWGRGGDALVPGSSGPDIDYGAGRLDAYAALRAVGAKLKSPPSMPVHQAYEGSLSGPGDAAEYPLDVVDASVPIGATLIVPNAAPGDAGKDFDLHLYDPDGNQVALSTGVDRQEQLGFQPPVAGQYTLRVNSWRGSGDFYLDASAGLPATSKPGPGQKVLCKAPKPDKKEHCKKK